MVKKKKSKGSKFARMSDEERARYMQHRAELELETRRRKQQLIAAFIKNKIKHEEAFSKLNSAKINEKWRYVLRQIKCKELHENVTHLCTSFDRAVRIKDKTIAYLYEELKTADIDHRKLQENHIELINNIIGKYKHKLGEFKDMYKFDGITVNNIQELIQIKNSMKISCNELSNIIFRRNNAFNETYSVNKTQNAVNTFSILYMENNISSDIVRQNFVRMNNIWQQFHKMLNEYESMIENKKKHHDYLKEQDDICQMSMLQYPREHLQLQNAIENLKYNIEILSLKKNERIDKLKENDASLKEKLKCMKNYFSMTEMMDSSQLKQLTVLSNTTLKHLQKIVEKGFAIAEMIKMCTNLQPSFTLRKYLIQETAIMDFKYSTIPESCNKVNTFWEQYNDIRVGNILLRKESNKLNAENENFKQKLQTLFTLNFGTLALHPVASPLN